eukprot:1147595-Pelagomonas_calceolata.AAC.7
MQKQTASKCAERAVRAAYTKQEQTGSMCKDTQCKVHAHSRSTWHRSAQSRQSAHVGKKQ